MTSSQPSEAGVWLDRALGFSAAVLLFCLMMLTTADVIGRYVFNWPIRGAFEITELLLLTLIFAGLPLASRADEHVTLDFIDMAARRRRPPAAAPSRRSRLRPAVPRAGLAVWIKAARSPATATPPKCCACRSARSSISWRSWSRSPASCT
jgi:hypothetical protein